VGEAEGAGNGPSHGTAGIWWRRTVENDEYARFVRRVMRACARQVASGDIDALADMTGLATELDEAIGQAVTGLRETGYSWAEIAARIGVSR
jgi:hypothetical protein